MRPLISLLRAEWQKTISNYLLTGFLIWIFPIGIGAFFAIALVSSFLGNEIGVRLMATASSAQWTTDMLGIWVLVTSSPANLIPRLLPMAFTTAMFAGEYQWGTWKNLIPRSQRKALIVSKYIVLLFITLLSLLLCSLIITVGQGLLLNKLGLPYGPDLTWDSFITFIGDYGRQLLLSATALTILIGYAALAALLTRSIMGGLLAGFGLSLVESLSIMLLSILGTIFNKPSLVNLYQFTPTYNIDNLHSWLINHHALIEIDPHFSVAPSALFSIISLSVWVFGLLALTIVLFEHQDIVS